MNLTEIVILADTLVIVIMAGIVIFTSKQLDNRIKQIRKLDKLYDEVLEINIDLRKRLIDMKNENDKLKKQIEGQKEVINLVATNKIKVAKKGKNGD